MKFKRNQFLRNISFLFVLLAAVIFVSLSQAADQTLAVINSCSANCTAKKGNPLSFPDELSGVSDGVNTSILCDSDSNYEMIETVIYQFYGMRFNFRINSIGTTLAEDDITKMIFNIQAFYTDPPDGYIYYYLENYDASPAVYDSIGAVANQNGLYSDQALQVVSDGTYNNLGKYIDASGNFNWLIESDQVAPGSYCCPLAFAFDGNKFQLVADIFRMASLGHPFVPLMTRPGIDRDEYARIDKLLPNKEGLLELRFVEPANEVSYIDQIKLLAVDHPDTVEILPNEYPTRSKPFPEFKIFQYEKLLPVKKAYDKNGVDFTENIKEIDGLYAPTKKTDIQGIVEPYSFTLELGDLADAKQIQLIANSYTTFVSPAFFKNIFKNLFHLPRLPVIEVPDGAGGWRVVKFKNSNNKMSLKSVGFFSKDLIYDLTDEFKNNDFRIRVEGNIDVSFDCFKINTFSDYKPIKISELKAKSASLDAYGKLKKINLELKGPIPYFDYYQVKKEEISNLFPGKYTRYGDVSELVKDSDDKLVIMATGDQLSVKFDEKDLPRLPAGFKRTYLLYSDGYYKWAMDDRPIFKTVEPLPFKAMSGYPYSKNEHYPADKEHQDCLEKYNTRVISPLDKHGKKTHHTMFVDNAYVTVSYNLVPTVTTPTVAANTIRQATNGSGMVTVTTKMSDVNSDTAQSMRIRYSVNGGTNWNKAFLDTTAGSLTADSGTPVLNNAAGFQITNVRAPVAGNNVNFKWDTKNSSNENSATTGITNSNIQTVKIRITPRNIPTAKSGTDVDTANFTVDNKGPNQVQSDSKYSYATKLLSIRFDETIKTEATPTDFDLTKINVTDGGVHSLQLSATDYFVVNDSSSHNDDTLDITLSDAERNAIDSWNASNVFVQVQAAAVKDFYGNSNADISNTNLVYTPSAANSFSVVPSSTSLRAGENFTLTVTAKTGTEGSGSIDTSYAGTANLTINYISPSTATTLSQTITTTPVSIVAGVGTATLSYPDCGIITITATDAILSSRKGISSNITFYPYSFTVAPINTTQTVAKPFNLTITAKNSNGAITPNYSSIVNITEDGTEGVLSDTQIAAADFSNGAATISESYDKYGTIKISATDNGYAGSTGMSEAIKFNPNSFKLVFETPLKDRTKFYINEPFKLSFSALDYSSNVISNYTGKIIASSTNSNFLTGLETSYTFVAGDAGTHTISNLRGTQEKDFIVSVKDAEQNSIIGSGPISVMYGKIIVVSTSGSVGTISTQVRVVDKDGKIITADNSTKFKVCYTEEVKDESITCPASAKAVTVASGVATISLTNKLAEKITVMPMPEPDSLATESGVVIFGAMQPGASNTFQWREVR